MSQPALPANNPVSQTKLIFQNVSVNYLVTGTELLIGVFMLPFNVAYLGQSAYGLWILVASVTVYFSMFDMGYGMAQVRSAAKYRAQGDTVALNEITSTIFYVFSGVGVFTFALTILLSFNLYKFFPLTSAQSQTGRTVLLFIGTYVALGFPTSVFGAIVNGFQRTYLNGIVAFVTAIVVAAVNVVVLLSGYGLVELVAATTAVRILSYIAYALNAYRVFPALRIRLKYFRRERLREVTGLSIFFLIIDIANKLNYSTDTIVIGAFLGTSAVVIWAVAQRLIEIVQRITDQLNSVLFPVVVDSTTVERFDRLQKILIQGTRLSLAMVVPLATVLGLTARPLVMVWVGPEFSASVDVIYILSVVVALRVGNATSAVILKGSDLHKFLAFSNLSMAVGNLVLSVLLVRVYGLIGVAIGTLIPMILISMFVVFPVACRRVDLSVLTVVRKSVWPATWPAILMGGFVLLTRGRIQSSWSLLILQSFVAAVIYAGLFLLFAISRHERDWYFNKVKEVFKRGSVTSTPTEFSMPS
ncbi:MAG TPA: oligosaccharide flippase family protein [Pyrinomonadaceae bacterium]|nr:oligosaccharide flippase family protein [Pyrinomonadaceae bacterium]